MKRKRLNLQSVAALRQAICRSLRDVAVFARVFGGVTLRRYQRDAAQALLDAVYRGEGGSFAFMFPRQSGKNEIQAHLETLLLVAYSLKGGEIIKISPTYKPQSLHAMRRLERVLQNNLILRRVWKKENGHIFRIGKARVIFLSAEPAAHIAGATASLLLQVDEAQEVQIAKFDKDIAPMAASTNAVQALWGTAWTGTTLLARELRTARALQAADGVQRTFVLTAEQVAAEVPSYRRHLQMQVLRLGRNHPAVRTQYFSEELDTSSGMFPPPRLALMRGDHLMQSPPGIPGLPCALLIDVAGEDESAAGDSSQALLRTTAARDATALTVVQVDINPQGLPLYRVVQRYLWVGLKHTDLYAQVLSLAELWYARCLVVDATGVGAGFTSFLRAQLGERVIPFVFSAASKSALGWDFLSIVDSGRFQDHRPLLSPPFPDLQAEFWRQCSYCTYQVSHAPARHMRWGVSDGTRHLATGEPVHDDLLISAALCARLEPLHWTPGIPAAILPAPDPLAQMDRAGF